MSHGSRLRGAGLDAKRVGPVRGEHEADALHGLAIGDSRRRADHVVRRIEDLKLGETERWVEAAGGAQEDAKRLPGPGEVGPVVLFVGDGDVAGVGHIESNRPAAARVCGNNPRAAIGPIANEQNGGSGRS